MKKEKNMKQSELAERLGVTNKTVSRWETGKYMPDYLYSQKYQKF